MKPFTESMRYEYPLTPDSEVWDVGAYKGTFAEEIFRRYGCNILCFEPIFHQALREKFAGNPKIHVSSLGLSNGTHTTHMGVQGDSTGEFSRSEERHVAVLDDVDVLMDRRIDLLKLNCEGAEFAILERLLECKKMHLIDYLQVQFHTVVPNYQSRWENIRAQLLTTHELMFDAPWCWEGYKLKS